jgi:hypothetical protein
MKKLLSLAIACAAFAAMAQTTYAKHEKEKAAPGKGTAAAPGQMRQQAVQQPAPVMQRPQRTETKIARRDVSGGQSQFTTRARAGTSGRTVTRTEPSVAFGGQTRAERRERAFTTNRTDVRRDWSDSNWNRGEVRFQRPPATVYRDWDHNRIYNWNDHRWHWYGGSWVIVDAGPDYAYYDEPVATSYVGTSGSLVADVQRQLSRDGYDPGPIDGVMGGQTRGAIMAFQRDSGLYVTGRIDSKLLDRLNLDIR